MNKQLALIIAGSIFALHAGASAGEPRAVIKKTSALKTAPLQEKMAIPRLLRPSLTLAQATEPPPAPSVDGHYESAAPVMEPIPSVMSGPMEGVQLYDCVKYEDLDNVHPCAVTKIVAVLDPCQNPCDCCGPRCVYVQICVPPCGCPEIKTSHSGKKVKYDYGKYEIEITSKKGMVEVDYDAGLFNGH